MTALNLSKATNEKLSLVTSMRDTTISGLAIALFPNSPRSKMRMSFYFKNEINSIFWNICFIYSLIKLGIYEKSFCSRWKGRERQELKIYLEYEKMDVFLQYLKGLLRRAQITGMYTCTQSIVDVDRASKIIDMSANFLEGKSLEHLSIGKAETENFDSWINLLTKARIKDVKIRTNNFEKRTVNFLLQVADLSRSLNIHLDCNHNPTLLAPLLRGMSSRKCAKIVFKSYHTLDILGIEQVIKIVSNQNKIIYISAYTNLVIPNTLQFGVFEVKAESILRIKHLEFTEDDL